MTLERYTVTGYWGPRQSEISDFAEDFCEFANNLADIDPIFTGWFIGNPKLPRLFELPLDKNIATIIAERNQKRFHAPNSKIPSDFGFSISGINCQKNRAGNDALHVAKTGVRAGSFISDESYAINPNIKGSPYSNDLCIELAKMRIGSELAWRASELLPLMKLVLKIWRPRQLSVDCQRHPHPMISDSSWASGERWLHPWAGWLTYLSPALFPKIDLPKGVIVEKLEFGGAIVALCEEPFTIDDPVHMARMRAMEAAMRPFQT